MNEEYYYIIENGERRGPFTGAALQLMGITADTLIWRPGVSDWVKVSDLPEASELLAVADSAFGTYAEQSAREGQGSGFQGKNSGYQSQSYQHGPYRQWAPGQPSYGQEPPYGRTQGQKPVKPHTDWAPWAIGGIILGLCSCIGLIFGIIGLINANKANAYYIAGDDLNGDIANSSAKSMTLVSLIIGGIGLVGGAISGILNTIFFNWG